MSIQNANDIIKKLRTERDLLTAKVLTLSSLIEVGMIVNSAIRLDEVMKLVMEKAQSVMNAEASSILIINEEKNVFEVPVALGEAGERLKTIEIPMDKGVAGWVAEHGKAQNIPDAYRDARFNPRVDEETGFKTRSILAAPLKVRDRMIGIAEVINRNDGEPFSDDDLSLFSAFCSQVAMAIENARIHELELEKQRISQQLDAAKHIQQSFMPETFPRSENGKFEVTARSIPAASVGGDMFDFVEFNHKKLGISVGDVSGKGIPAALYMARLVSDFRLYSRVYDDSSRMLHILNKALTERSRRGMFVTFLYGILDSESGEFTYSNAGHLPVIRVHRDSKNVELLHPGSGIPLGISPSAGYEHNHVQLNRGDFLVLITDGVVEAKNKEGEAYAFDRLKIVLKKNRKSAEDLLNAIIEDIKSFSSDLDPHDDVTIVVLKWC